VGGVVKYKADCHVVVEQFQPRNFFKLLTVFLSDGVEIFPDDGHSESEERFRVASLAGEV